MYFKFEQVGLTQDKAERQPADEAVYVMEHPVTGERVLVPGSSLGDKELAKYTLAPYGTGYFSVDDRFWVIPNEWSEHDADICYMANRD